MVINFNTEVPEKEEKTMSEPKIIPMQISEVADRYAICLLKAQRLPSKEERDYFSEQADHYLDALPDALVSPTGQQFTRFKALLDINMNIWDTESDIRTGAADTDLDLAMIGNLALRVRDLNRQRCKIKNDISDHFGGYKECKHNYGKD
jgi:hypothetical protein